MRVCTFCNLQFSDEKRFCNQCGRELTDATVSTSPSTAAGESDKVFCGQCGAEQEAWQNYCVRCGAKLRKGSRAEILSVATPSEPERTSQTVAGGAQKIETVGQDSTLRSPTGEWPSETPSTLEPEEAENAMPTRRRWFVVAAAALVLVIATGMTFVVVKKIRERRAAERQAAEAAATPSAASLSRVDEATRHTLGVMNSVLEAIEQYASKRNRLPVSLAAAIANDVLESVRDGWGRSPVFLVDVAGKTYELISVGPDGKRGTDDDIRVTNESVQSWRASNEELINEWRILNVDLNARILGIKIETPAKPANLAAQKAEEEKLKAEAEEQAKAEQLRLEEEQRRKEAELAEARRVEEERRKAEEARLARERAEAERRARFERMNFTDDFSQGLARWNASGWQWATEKGKPVVRLSGMGFLKNAYDFDNFTATFEVRIQKEGVGWIIRARDSANFYYVKLTSDKAKNFRKNCLLKYILLNGRYQHGMETFDVRNAASVVEMPMKVKQGDLYRITVVVSGNTIKHYLNGQLVDSWQDETFRAGAFGFNVSDVEAATLHSFRMSTENR